MPGVRHAFVVEGTTNLEGLIGRGGDRGRHLVGGPHGAASSSGSPGTRDRPRRRAARASPRRPRSSQGSRGAKSLRNDGDVDAAFAGRGQGGRGARTPTRSSPTRRSSRRTAPRTSRTASSRSGRRPRSRSAGRSSWPSTLGIAESDITIHLTRMGGGFGRRLTTTTWSRRPGSRRRRACRSSCCGRAKTTCSTTSTVPAGFHYLKGGVDASGRLVGLAGPLRHASATASSSRQAAAISDSEFPARFVPNFRLETSVMPLGRADRVRCARRAATRSPSSSSPSSTSWRTRRARTRSQFRLDLLGEPRLVTNPDGKRGLRRRPDAGCSRARRREVRLGQAARCPRAAGWAWPSTSATAATSPRWPRWVSTPTARCGSTRSGWRATSAARSSTPAAPRTRCRARCIDGIGEALGQEITIERGRAQQSNFHDYPLLRMTQAPAGRGALPQDGLPADRPRRARAAAGRPGGRNAIFAATGKRVRTLPLSKHDLRA